MRAGSDFVYECSIEKTKFTLLNCSVFHRTQFIVNEVKLKTTRVLNRLHNCALLQKLRVAAG